MATVLVIAAALWGLARALSLPRQALWLMWGLLYVAVLFANLALPAAHPLAQATGGSAGEWLVLGGLALLVWGYRAGLARLRRKVRPENRKPEPAPARPDPEAPFTEAELERYARHIVLREIGGPGQRKVKRAKVLVIGAGGLGAPAILYLAAAGVGRIGVIDDDVVEPANLQRQVIHSAERAGMPKVFSAAEAVAALNPLVELRPYHRRFTPEIGAELVADYDLVLDGCDNAETRYAVNAACVAAGVPLISGALGQWEGQVTTFLGDGEVPCYRCLFPEPAAPGLAPSCAEGGVLGPLPGIVGSMMAAEAVKEITGAGQGLRGRMAIHDALYADHRVVTLKRRPGCADCGAV